MSIFLTLQGRGLLSLPSALRKRHNLDRPGAQVEVVERDDGVIELIPQISVPADQAWFWTKRWQEMEREADKEFERGEVVTHNSAEEFRSYLEELQR